MKVLLDTNVLVAAFATRGQCADVFATCRSNHSLVVSERVLDEMRAALVEKIDVRPAAARDMVRLVRLASVIVPTPPLERRVCRDADDDHVLSAARAGETDCLVTGDRDLLDQHYFDGIPILTPANFWRFEAEHGQPRR